MEVGYGRLSMESVAEEAGVARATVYRRYRNKADLVTAAIAEYEAADPSPEPSDDPRNDLLRFLADFDNRFTRSCVEVLGSLLANHEDPRSLALHRERVIALRRAYVRSLLERARDLGQLDPEVDLDLALEMLVGVVIARAVGGMPSLPGWAQRALELIWSTVGADTR
jgi:AcrR family transcriptional regulator